MRKAFESTKRFSEYFGSQVSPRFLYVLIKEHLVELYSSLSEIPKLTEHCWNEKEEDNQDPASDEEKKD